MRTLSCRINDRPNVATIESAATLWMGWINNRWISAPSMKPTSGATMKSSQKLPVICSVAQVSTVPTMKKSPCARLMMSSRPKMMARPSAISAMIRPQIIALIALGLAIIFGLLDIINLAHGDFFMVGTVLTWATLQMTGSFWLDFIVAPLVGFILGALIQRLLIQPIHNVAALSIVATFGLSLILQESVRITYGPTPGRILPPIRGTIS